MTVSLNGKDYTTTVSADGSWTLNVPAADLVGLSDGSVTVTASVSDKAGNPASADHTSHGGRHRSGGDHPHRGEATRD